MSTEFVGKVSGAASSGEPFTELPSAPATARPACFARRAGSAMDWCRPRVASCLQRLSPSAAAACLAAACLAAVAARCPPPCPFAAALLPIAGCWQHLSAS